MADKCDRRHVHMTGKSETACEYPASFVVAMLSAIKRQMISDGAIRVGQLHFAGPVAELEGKWRVDGIWIDPKLLIAGRKEEMEYMRKMGVFEVVDGEECYDNGCKPQTEMGGQDGRREIPFEIGLLEDQKDQRQRRTTWARKRILTHAAVGRVEYVCLHNDDRIRRWKTTQTVRLRWQRGTYRERTSTVKLAGGSTHIYLKDIGKLARLCRSMYGTRDAASIWGDARSEVLKDGSMKVGTACSTFCCSHDGDLKGLCHGDAFCVVARRKQLQIFGKVLGKTICDSRRSKLGTLDSLQVTRRS